MRMDCYHYRHAHYFLELLFTAFEMVSHSTLDLPRDLPIRNHACRKRFADTIRCASYPCTDLARISPHVHFFRKLHGDVVCDFDYIHARWSAIGSTFELDLKNGRHGAAKGVGYDPQNF